MKKLLLSLSAMVLLSSISMAATQNIAVVDVQAIVNKSAQVQSLKKEQQTKIADLEKWLKTAQEDVAKQQSKEGKEKLLKKYNSEFAKKKEVIAKDYKTKLSAVDKSITETITTKAKAMGYDMVISKSMVIMGGDDITAEIQKVVK
jgi:outer membrane protein